MSGLIKLTGLTLAQMDVVERSLVVEGSEVTGRTRSETKGTVPHIIKGSWLGLPLEPAVLFYIIRM